MSKSDAAPDSFEKLGIEPALSAALKDAHGISIPSAVQYKAIPSILEHASMSTFSPLPIRDFLIRAQTGAGKTFSFILPFLNILLGEREKFEGLVNEIKSTLRNIVGPQLLVIVPTRELAQQIVSVLEKLFSKLKSSHHWLVVSALSGGDRKKSEKARLRKGVHIVVATPGRLLDHLENTRQWTDQVVRGTRWICVDEADRLMDLGFEPTIERILTLVGMTKKQLVLCSATIGKDTKKFANCILRDPIYLSSQEKLPSSAKMNHLRSEDENETFSAPTQLEQKYLNVPTRLRLITLLGLLQDFYKADPATKMVVFFSCCDAVDFHYRLIELAMSTSDDKSPLKMLVFPKGIGRFRLHGNLEQSMRQSTFKAFSNAIGPALLFCTDVAARGLDLPRVSCIIQYDAPCDLLDYLHRAGRTARQTQQGTSILFLMPSEIGYLELLKQRGMTPTLMDHQSCFRWVLPTALTIDDRILATWQTKLETWMVSKSNEELAALSTTAFGSSVRAYTTHPSSEKHVFHTRNVHLGHWAASYGLKEAPTKMIHVTPSSRFGTANPRKNNAIDPKQQATIRTAGLKRKKKNISEFAEGDKRPSKKANNDLSILSAEEEKNKSKKKYKLLEHKMNATVTNEFGAGDY